MTVCEPESKRLQRSQGPIQGRFELCIENAVYGIRRSESRSELCPCAHPRTAARTADTCFASSELGLEGGGGTRKRLVPLGPRFGTARPIVGITCSKSCADHASMVAHFEVVAHFDAPPQVYIYCTSRAIAWVQLALAVARALCQCTCQRPGT